MQQPFSQGEINPIETNNQTTWLEPVSDSEYK